MHKRFTSYLRTHRRLWGFTQRELASLIGVKSGTLVSRVESSRRTPSLSAAFACSVIFGAAPVELFPGINERIQLSIVERATALYEELQGNPSKATRIKLDFLESLLARLQKLAETDV